MKRKIIGIQVHHSVNLDDASRFGVNMLTAMDAAMSRMLEVPPHLVALRDQLGVAIRDLGVIHREEQGHMQTLWMEDPELFVRAREGYVPWPDENDNVELRPE